MRTDHHPSRRAFLKGAGLVAASTWIGALPASKAQTPTPSRGTLKIRKNVGSLPVNDPILETYRKAVLAMKALPDSDGRSWTRQAQIHQTRCPHGNWFFLPWHRAYIHYFESICREVTHDPDFALPYWNWTTDPQIPAAFWGSGNPLDHSRDIGPNDTADPEFVGTAVMTEVLGFTRFEQFGSLKSTKQRGGGGGGSSELESRPHNYIHATFIGGDMATFMSPLDPIFWLHHANIDRLWAKWNELGRANTNDVVWTDYKFDGDFVNANGQPQTKRVAEFASTYALNYRYDDQASTPPPAGIRVPALLPVAGAAVESDNKLFAKPNQPSEVSLPLNQRLSQNFAFIARAPALEPFALTAPKEVPRKTVRLRISDITPPKNKTTTVRVFINCPYLSVETPINDPHYVTSFAFFGGHGEGEHQNGNFEFVADLTKALGALNRQKALPIEELKVQLLALPKNRQEEGAEVIASKFQITVESEGGKE
jgi:tyrosinase